MDVEVFRQMIRHGEVDRPVLQRIAHGSGVEFSDLKYSVEHRLLPPERELHKLTRVTGISSLEYRLLLGVVDASVRQVLQDHATHIAALAEEREYLQRIRSDLNCLFTARTLALRQQNGLWTAESVRGGQQEEQSDLFSFAG